MEEAKCLRHVLARPDRAGGEGEGLPVHMSLPCCSRLSLLKWAYVNKSLKSKVNKEAP